MRQSGYYHVKLKTKPDEWAVACYVAGSNFWLLAGESIEYTDVELESIDERIIIREEPSQPEKESTLKDKKYEFPVMYKNEEGYSVRAEIAQVMVTKALCEIIHDLAIQVERIANQGVVRTQILETTAKHLEPKEEVAS